MAKKTQPQASGDAGGAGGGDADRTDTSALERVRVNNQQIARWFTYHPPDDEQVQQLQRIRQAGAAFAQIVKDNTPGSADQSDALRKIREAVMTANAAVVLRGK